MDRPTQTPQQAIEALLHQHMGLNANTMGEKNLAQAVKQSSEALGLSGDTTRYWQHLQTSEQALSDLIESVVVPETSFFRNPESFSYLRHYLLSTLATQPHHYWRVLSLPCSTGEEPYSIAITFLEAGIYPASFHIDAVDISAVALAKAQQGIYERYSFRQTAPDVPEHYISKYFQIHQERYYLDPGVRSQVQFHQDNLAKPLCLNGQPPYDIIFCRNLLIYFHQAARDCAIQTLYRLLKPNGLLFVGYAETSLFSPHQFASLQIPQAFVYRKLSQQPTVHTKPKSRSNHQTSQHNPIKPVAVAPSQSPWRQVSQSTMPDRTSSKIQAVPQPAQPLNHPGDSLTASAEPSSITELATIQDFANQGQLTLALEHCDRYLKAHPTSAEAYVLLGEIYQAQGSDDRAEIAFQKALYLNPSSIDALIHCLLLCEQKGDNTAVERLRQRLKRLEP